jgi:hypothetical protein
MNQGVDTQFANMAPLPEISVVRQASMPQQRVEVAPQEKYSPAGWSSEVPVVQVPSATQAPQQTFAWGIRFT